MIKHFNFSRPVLYHWIFFTAVIIFFITAYNSHGYFHADEHYQIIEFALLKLGINIPSNLVWEFRAQIRSAFQPTLCVLVFNFFKSLHVTDVYMLIFFMRLLTAIFALFIIHQFIKSTDDLIQNKSSKIAYYLLSYFIWFIPFISVRYASETWGGLFFMAALCIYVNKTIEKRKLFLVGCMLGFAFLCRFQMAFSTLDFGCWLIFIDKILFKQFTRLIAGFLLIIVLGILIDSWFYKNIVFTPWNYFYTFYDDTINNGATAFAASPWYTYVGWVFYLPGYFLGLPILLALIIAIFTKSGNIFIWCILPFFVIHTCVPHKESRFLFPMVYLIPIILVTAYEKLIQLLNVNLLRILNFIFIVCFFTFNLSGLVALGSVSAGIGKIGLTKYIHEHYSELPLNMIHCPDAFPYDECGILTRPYPEKIWNSRKIGNLCELSDSLIVAGEENFLFIRKKDLQLDSCKNKIILNHFIFKKQSIPTWVEWLNATMYRGFDNKEIIELYERKK